MTNTNVIESLNQDVRPPVKKSVNALGIASIIVAAIAVLICWVPLIGLLSIPLALVALLLALIGGILSVTGGKLELASPIVGALTAIAAIVGFVVIIALAVSSINSMT